ncbi:hypothetical protein LCGC14_1979430 [marine sediment metagenome]|uniref:Uncharacterized protein n=1 Tax=marine sediment metagenome TaxID=412755 RepID=A0A0F9HMP0_9ZZZZ
MDSKLANRKLFPVRFSPAELVRVKASARARRQSTNSFIVHCCLAACDGKHKDYQDWGAEAEVAVIALVGTGKTEQEALAMIRAVVSRNPKAGAGELLKMALERAQ